jgi:DNA invertase Pin-like site-specific DNA recombinase
MNNLRYIRYSRKSSEAKERQVASINDQNLECEQYALKENLNVVYKLQESKTAYKPNSREVFNEMLQLIESGKADAILTWHPNRLCRNPEEGGKLLQKLQDGVIKEIRSPSGDVYAPENDQLVLQINFGIANQYSRDISRNVKRALKHKVERGEYPGDAFFGYKMVGDKGKKNLIPDTFEAPLIKKIFELESTGQYSLTNIGNFLYKKGLVARNGQKLCKEQVRRMLTNSSYYGYFKHKGELYKGNYEPLISKSLFDKAQEKLADRSKPQVNIWDKMSYNGLVKCPSCGSAITTSFKTKFYKETNRTANYVYLHCTRRKGHCEQSPIRLNEFESKVLDKISKISIDKEVWELGIKLLKAKNKDQLERSNEQLDRLNMEYKIMQGKLNKLIDMRANNELTKEEFMIQKTLALNEQARVEGLIRDVKTSEHNWLELAEEFLDNAFYARGVMESGKILEKRNLLMDIGENFFLEDKNPVFSFKKPYDVLLKPEYRHFGRE